ncbi:hypothetical protein WA538_004806, partial [Blastocystis sp. DL]
MNSSQTHLLLDAFFHFVFTTIVNCILFCILFYAVFKTVTSLEDENEREKWLKYWVFYGLFSVICSYLEKGSFIKACVCGVLLLKFNNNIILHFTYDVVLSNLLKNTYGYLIVIMNACAYDVFLLVEKLHWTILTTINKSDAVCEESLQSFSQCRDVIMQREKQLWKKEGETISLRKPADTNTSAVRNTVTSLDEYMEDDQCGL